MSEYTNKRASETLLGTDEVPAFKRQAAVDSDEDSGIFHRQPSHRCRQVISDVEFSDEDTMQDVVVHNSEKLRENTLRHYNAGEGNLVKGEMSVSDHLTALASRPPRTKWATILESMRQEYSYNQTDQVSAYDSQHASSDVLRVAELMKVPVVQVFSMEQAYPEALMNIMRLTERANAIIISKNEALANKQKPQKKQQEPSGKWQTTDRLVDRQLAIYDTKLKGARTNGWIKDGMSKTDQVLGMLIHSTVARKVKRSYSTVPYVTPAGVQVNLTPTAAGMILFQENNRLQATGMELVGKLKRKNMYDKSWNEPNSFADIFGAVASTSLKKAEGRNTPLLKARGLFSLKDEKHILELFSPGFEALLE